jgi:hypothetical protein
MEQNSGPSQHYSAYYNRHLLAWRRDLLGLSNRKLAELIPANRQSVRAVFRGMASYKTLYPVAAFLGLDWAMLHSLTLSEPDYPLAVRAGAHLIAPKQAGSNSA